MNIQDIRFEPRISLDKHPRYPSFRNLVGVKDFAAYREVFERGWAETSIMCGENTRLSELPITDKLPSGFLLPRLMGINQHAPKRVGFAEEFIGQYEQSNRQAFLKNIAQTTAYVKDIRHTENQRLKGPRGLRRFIAKLRMEKRIKYRIETFLNVYENMKRFGTLVGRSHVIQKKLPPLEASDVPWAIEYKGYIKLREGAHRRAAAQYLGWGTIPTLIFEFDKLTTPSMKDAHPYLKDNFEWFVRLIDITSAADL